MGKSRNQLKEKDIVYAAYFKLNKVYFIKGKIIQEYDETCQISDGNGSVLSIHKGNYGTKEFVQDLINKFVIEVRGVRVIDCTK